MFNQQDDPDRLPLPSEMEGDLVNEPATGDTDDPVVATEEGVPYVPPSDRVLSESRFSESGPDVAGTAPTDAGELGREDDVQPPSADVPSVGSEGLTDEAGDEATVTELEQQLPTDVELRDDVVERLRASDVSAGDRLQVATVGSTVILRGEVESVDILEEIIGIVGEVPGVEDVVDEVDVQGV
jgi:hypothetical protein